MGQFVGNEFFALGRAGLELALVEGDVVAVGEGSGVDGLC
jgi:hypothetical protein